MNGNATGIRFSEMIAKLMNKVQFRLASFFRKNFGRKVRGGWDLLLQNFPEINCEEIGF
jgi:hypothetical protein